MWGYEPQPPDNRPWQAFDPSINPASPFYALVNNLHSLRYGRGYWINISTTQNITLYLQSSTGVSAASVADVESVGTSAIPPAVYYGGVWQTEDFTPLPGMPVTAWIDGQICGETQTQDIGGAIGFVMQIPAVGDSTYANCGVVGRTVTFQVAGVPMLVRASWDNTSARLTPLFNRFVNPVFLPIIAR